MSVPSYRIVARASTHHSLLDNRQLLVVGKSARDGAYGQSLATFPLYQTTHNASECTLPSPTWPRWHAVIPRRIKSSLVSRISGAILEIGTLRPSPSQPCLTTPPWTFPQPTTHPSSTPLRPP